VSDSVGSFGQLSLFLTLAFGFPGIVYLGFAYLYFPAEVSTALASLNLLAPSGTLFSGLVGIAVVFFVGLTLTSVFFALEFLVFRRIGWVRKRLLPEIRFNRIMALQLKGKDVSLLLQQSGQAIMHYNIWSGVLFITLFYWGNALVLGQPISWSRLGFGFVIVGANMVAASKLFEWSAQAIAEADKDRTGNP